MIEISHLHKVYEDEGVRTNALRGISFSIHPGEFVAIMGPSGSGKSTLLHILSFLDRPTEGAYTFFGRSINDLSDTELAHIRNEGMGFVFQAFNLLARSSVYENVELPLLYNANIPASRRKQLIESAVHAVGLNEKLHTEVGKLSGGQKQRIAIARAFVTSPNVIFADEPTGNLDSHSGEQVMGIFEELHRTGRTIILVTHETYTAAFADRHINLKDGIVASDEVVHDRRKMHHHAYFK